LAARAKVSICWQFDTPDSKKSYAKAKYPIRCLSPASSLHSSSDDESTDIDEDDLPINELVVNSKY
jgi:hypothetical protein